MLWIRWYVHLQQRRMQPLDIHPAALWGHLPHATPNQRMTGLWRRRAHLIAQEPDALPERVAKFCEAR